MKAVKNHRLYSQLTQYALLSRQHKPVGTFLLLGPTSWGLVVAANGEHDLLIVFVFLLGTWLMRSAGCVINDYADRNFDRHVERTKERPLTSGMVSEKEALWLFAFFVSMAFVLVLLLRIEAILLSLGALFFAVIYPFMKRFIWFPQVFLGLAFSLAIPMAFMAYQGRVPMLGLVMFLLSFLWIFAYDTIYAMVDVRDDRKVGIKSTALFFAQHTFLAVALMQGLFVLGWMLVIWFYQAEAGFWWMLVLVIVCFAYQGVLIRSGKNDKILRAFVNNQWVGLFIFFGLVFFPVT